ncbi:MAG: O-antigen ligase family protein [Elainellaceae cyanobacterium]
MKISSHEFKSKLEYAFAFIALQYSTGAFFVTLNRAGIISYGILQALWLLIYVVSFGLILRRWKRGLWFVSRDKLLLLLIGIACASVFWSTAPGTTMYRLIALLGTVLFGMYLPTRFSARELFKLLVWVMSVGAVMSVVFAIALPAYGVTSGGSWQGVYQHKNLMGRMMALNVPFLMLVQPRKSSHQLIVWGMIGLSALLVVLSRSAGALVYCVALVGLLYFYRPLRWRDRLAIPVFLILIALIGIMSLWLIANLENIVVNQLGKDLTLTGRTDIWNAAIHMIQQRPWLGYGYGAFWLGEYGPSEYIIRATGWDEIPHSHNGFIDLCLNIGLLGVITFTTGIFLNIVSAIKRLRFTRDPMMLWALVALSFIFLSNLSESEILKHNSFFWVLYVATVLARPVELSQRLVKPAQTDASPPLLPVSETEPLMPRSNR